MNVPVPFDHVRVKKVFFKTLMSLIRKQLFGSIPVLDECGCSVGEMAIDITAMFFGDLGYNEEEVKFYCLTQQRVASQISSKISHSISLANVKAHAPLAGEALRTHKLIRPKPTSQDNE